MCSGGQRRIEGSPCEKIQRKSRKQSSSNKQTEESVVRKSGRLQQEDGSGQSSGGEQRKMEDKARGDSKDQKSIAHSGFLSEKMRIQARLSDS